MNAAGVRLYKWISCNIKNHLPHIVYLTLYHALSELGERTSERAILYFTGTLTEHPVGPVTRGWGLCSILLNLLVKNHWHWQLSHDMFIKPFLNVCAAAEPITQVMCECVHAWGGLPRCWDQCCKQGGHGVH